MNVVPGCHPVAGTGLSAMLMAYSTVCPLPCAVTVSTVILLVVGAALTCGLSTAAPTPFVTVNVSCTGAASLYVESPDFLTVIVAVPTPVIVAMPALLMVITEVLLLEKLNEPVPLPPPNMRWTVSDGEYAYVTTPPGAVSVRAA